MTEQRKDQKDFPHTDDAYSRTLMQQPSKLLQNLTGYGSGANFQLTQIEMEDVYTFNGFGRAIVDKPADEMTRAGFCLDNIDDGLKIKIESRMQELNAMHHFNLAIKWARVFGGSLIVLGINDGGLLEAPLNETAIKSVEFIRVYNRFECNVNSKYKDPNNYKYGQTEFWQISPSNLNPYLVHESRVFIIDGDIVTNKIRETNDGWGASVFQKGFAELLRLNNGHKWAEMLLQRSQQGIHGIPDLSQTLADPDGERLITKRIDVVDRVRNAQNTIVIDSLETYDVKSFSLTNVPEILDRFAEAVSTVYGIPIFVLMGRSVGGLNSTGEKNAESWYSIVESMQNTYLRNPLDRLITFVMLGFTGGKSDGGDYILKFEELSVPSEVEQTEIDKKNADKDKVIAETRKLYIDMGSLDPDEVRKEIAETMDFIDLSITIEPPPELIPKIPGMPTAKPEVKKTKK